MLHFVIRFLSLFIATLSITFSVAILARVLMSHWRYTPGNLLTALLGAAVYIVSEIALTPTRRFLPQKGPIDQSPLVATIAIGVIGVGLMLLLLLAKNLFID